MNKRIFGIPFLAVLVMVLAIPVIAFAAYAIMTIVGTYNVTEPITISPSSWTVGTPGVPFHAGETSIKDVTVTNAASVPIEIDLVETVTGPSPAEFTVTFTKKVTVPATGSIVVAVTAKASNSTAPGAYTVSIGTTR